MNRKYIITDYMKGRATVLLHETYTTEPVRKDGDDLVIPLKEIIVCPHCFPNESDRYLAAGEALLCLHHVKSIQTQSGGEIPFVGTHFTIMEQQYFPDRGMLILNTWNYLRQQHQVFFEILCDAPEYRFNEFKGDSWLQQIRSR